MLELLNDCRVEQEVRRQKTKLVTFDMVSESTKSSGQSEMHRFNLFNGEHQNKDEKRDSFRMSERSGTTAASSN